MIKLFQDQDINSTLHRKKLHRVKSTRFQRKEAKPVFPSVARVSRVVDHGRSSKRRELCKLLKFGIKEKTNNEKNGKGIYFLQDSRARNKQLKHKAIQKLVISKIILKQKIEGS